MINDLFSRGILLGLGVAVAGKEKLEDTIMKMVDQGMMSKNEADSMFNDLMKKGAEKSESWNKDIRNSVTSQLRELGFVTKDQVDTLQAQIVLLQQELAAMRNKDNQQPDTTIGSGTGLGTAGGTIVTEVNGQPGTTGDITDSTGQQIKINTDILPD